MSIIEHTSASSPIPSGALSTLDARRQQVASSNAYALGYLYLCQIIYTGESDATQSITDIETMFKNQKIPVYNPGESWNLEWGPVASSDNSNLMFFLPIGMQRVNRCSAPW
jgi:hypothetical protein